LSYRRVLIILPEVRTRERTQSKLHWPAVTRRSRSRAPRWKWWNCSNSLLAKSASV